MTPRLPAGERKAQVIDLALQRFAHGGYTGTSTEVIAADVGVSQPYLFRLFGTKRDLFIACCRRACGRVGETFRAAAAATPADAEAGEKLGAMGQAYRDLVEDKYLLRFMLQMYAATSDPEIRAASREGYAALVDLVRELSGGDEEQIFSFFAAGMLINVMASLDLTLVHPEA
jgi:AcrR family transcriptional regulator